MNREQADRPEVIIVGAGPTGLTAALTLAGYGVRSVVLDAAVAAPTTSRAVLVHASTLELLDELGVADDLVGDGRVIRRLGLADSSGMLLDVALDDLPTRRPYALSVPQQVTEHVLRDRAGAVGVPILLGHQVTSVDTRGSSSVVRGLGAERQPFRMAGRYLIGADGAHSVVRHQLRIGVRGDSYPMPLALADVDLRATKVPDDMSMIQLSPAGVTVLIRLPAGNHRVVFTFAPGSGPATDPDAAWLTAELDRRGVAATPAAEPTWTSRFSVHHRLADTFGVGSAFLAGDAAHLHSPASGQGMNTGIADGYDLGHRIGRALTGAEPTLLDGYGPSRRRAATEVIRFTDAMTRMATASHPVIRLTRRGLADVIGRLPPARRRLAVLMSGLQRSPAHA